MGPRIVRALTGYQTLTRNCMRYIRNYITPVHLIVIMFLLMYI